MKISLNWLNTYLQQPVSADKAADILTRVGLEVEDIEVIENIPGGLQGVVIGKVLKKEKHPDADRLSVTQVDVGNSEVLQIVCGASNVDAGQTVAVALPGTTIYGKGGALKIKKSSIRGIESNGMICAEDEIGLGDSHEGIMVLPDQLAAGTPAADFFEIESDTMLELNITPNRVDATSHMGVARDIVAYMSIHGENNNIKKPLTVIKAEIKNAHHSISVIIENNNDCPRYTGALIENIKVKESPAWLTNKLKTIGLKPINNIVDITNYVLFETGQPLHAFDGKAIKGNEIHVKKAGAGEIVTTLDQAERKLTSDDLIIFNSSEPMCIAGVLGGIHSGVNENTTSVFIESAYFNPTTIRKTAKYHGIHTDASFRFERGTDPNMTVYALQRAIDLMCEIAGGELKDNIIDIYPEQVKPFVFTMLWKKLNQVSGIDFPIATAKQIIQLLGIEIINENAEGIEVAVPTNKVDVIRDIDLIEEVMRIYGYDKIELRDTLSAVFKNEKENSPRRTVTKIKKLLTANGFNEILTLSLDHAENYKSWPEENQKELIHLENPISSELDVMRRSMLFTSLQVAAHNLNRKNSRLKLFELGRIYFKDNDAQSENHTEKYKESQQLSILISGDEFQDAWYLPERKSDFFGINGICESIVESLRIPYFKISPIDSHHFYEKAFACYSKMNKQTPIYICGKISKKTLKQVDIKQDIWFAEFNWDLVLKSIPNAAVTFSELPKFPMVKRDLALLLDKSKNYNEIYSVSQKTIKEKLKDVQLFDVYEGKNIPEGKKSYGVRFTFYNKEKTLTDQEIEKYMDQVMTALTDQLGAEIRKN